MPFTELAAAILRWLNPPPRDETQWRLHYPPEPVCGTNGRLVTEHVVMMRVIDGRAQYRRLTSVERDEMDEWNAQQW